MFYWISEKDFTHQFWVVQCRKERIFADTREIVVVFWTVTQLLCQTHTGHSVLIWESDQSWNQIGFTIRKEQMWCNLLCIFNIIHDNYSIKGNNQQCHFCHNHESKPSWLFWNPQSMISAVLISRLWLNRSVEVNQWDLVMLRHRPSVWFWWFLMLWLWGNHSRLLNVLFILQIFCKAGSVLHGQVRVPPSLSLCSVLQPLTTLLLRELDADSPPLCLFAVVNTVTFSITLGMHDILGNKSTFLLLSW